MVRSMIIYAGITRGDPLRGRMDGVRIRELLQRELSGQNHHKGSTPWHARGALDEALGRLASRYSCVILARRLTW